MQLLRKKKKNEYTLISKQNIWLYNNKIIWKTFGKKVNFFVMGYRFTFFPISFFFFKNNFKKSYIVSVFQNTYYTSFKISFLIKTKF